MPSSLNPTNSDLYDLQLAGLAYRAADITRTNKDWLPPHRSGDGAIEESWDLMTSRIRDLMRNDPVMRKCKREICKGVIGANGIQTFSEAETQQGDPLDDFNEEADEFFERYCEQEIDYNLRSSWSSQQWLCLEETMETGDCLVIECWDDSPDRMIPLCYQLIEGEQIDETKDWEADPKRGLNYCRRGIEYAPHHRPVAYWLFDANPYDFSISQFESVRVPAERVIHSYLPSRVSAHRGATWFSANMQTSRDIDWYLGNELTAAALGALLTAYIKRKSGSGSAPAFTDEDGDSHSMLKLGRGTIAELKPEEEVGTIESNRPNRDADPFIKLLLMMQGMGIGLSTLRVTGDYSQASYTSARGSHLDDQAYFAVLQNWASRKIISPVRRRVIAVAAAQGKLETVSARDYLRHQKTYERISVQPPGREQLDPDSEQSAVEGRIRSCTSSYQIECGLRGQHWRKVAKQRAREEKYFHKLKLKPDLSHTAAYLNNNEGAKEAKKERRQKAKE